MASMADVQLSLNFVDKRSMLLTLNYIHQALFSSIIFQFNNTASSFVKVKFHINLTCPAPKPSSSSLRQSSFNRSQTYSTMQLTGALVLSLLSFLSLTTAQINAFDFADEQAALAVREASPYVQSQCHLLPPPAALPLPTLSLDAIEPNTRSSPIFPLPQPSLPTAPSHSTNASGHRPNSIADAYADAIADAHPDAVPEIHELFSRAAEAAKDATCKRELSPRCFGGNNDGEIHCNPRRTTLPAQMAHSNPIPIDCYQIATCKRMKVTWRLNAGNAVPTPALNQCRRVCVCNP
ncbi:hypothetical protein MMC26_006439 [Xylographa opegraphella]|nr:hypothetical protein [Xylographa opegraphella]